MIKSEGFIVIDGTSGIEEQQQLVRKTIIKLFPHKEGQKLQESILQQQ
jgi:hypothetical protein